MNAPWSRAAQPIAMSVKTAAAAVDVSTDTIRDAIYAMKLPAHKVGSEWRIKTADLEAWLDAMPTRQDEEDAA